MAVKIFTQPSNTAGTKRQFFLADAAADLPASGVNEGDEGYTLDHNQTWRATGANSWTELSERTAYKAADESISNTTLQDDDHLSVNLVASSKYYFRLVLFVSNAGAVEGFKAALSGTVGVASLKAQISIYDDVANSLAAFARVTALDAAVGAGLSSGENFVTIKGTIETTTAGTFKLAWAQNGGLGVSPTTVQRNSYMMVRVL